MLGAVRDGGIEFDDAELLAEWRGRHNGIVNTEHLRDGVREFLDDAVARGLPMAVASSATRDWLDVHLERVGVRGLFAAVCARDNGTVKPAPTSTWRHSTRSVSAPGTRSPSRTRRTV